MNFKKGSENLNLRKSSRKKIKKVERSKELRKKGKQ
jgi:hypothetical protein